MGITQKGPGDVRGYPKGAVKNPVKSHGSIDPAELSGDAEDGVSDTIKADGFNKEIDYTPKAQSNTGDSGLG